MKKFLFIVRILLAFAIFWLGYLATKSYTPWNEVPLQYVPLGVLKAVFLDLAIFIVLVALALGGWFKDNN